MPKELTHWILAERALAGLGNASRLRQLILSHHDCYLGGAVLPDTLLHLFRGPYAKTALALARGFHNTPDNSFAPLIRAEARFPDGLPPATLACLLGVISHMQADIVFHPLVFALTGTAGIGRHYQLETELDLHFLHAGCRPPRKKVAELMSTNTRATLLDSCALLFDPERQLPHQALEQGLDLHCRLQGLYDRSFWKLAVRLAALLAGAPFRDQRHLFYPLLGARRDRLGAAPLDWRHPVSGEARRTSIGQLADAAVQRMLTTFERIEEAGSLAPALTQNPGENLLTGLHGACMHEKH